MSFLQPLILVALPLVALPILIHLINQYRHRTVPWAAIAEVIEILLEAHRLPNAPMIVKAPPATAKAMMLAGAGDDASRAFIETRAPVQATGKTGRVLPEEYRQGLDVYLNVLGGGTE